MRTSLAILTLLAACGTTPTPPTPPVPATEPVTTEPAPPHAPTEPAPAPAATSPLSGAWTITEVGGAPLAEGQSADLTFGDDGSVSGKSGCNRMTGSYTVGGAGVSFGPLATTRMMCPPPDMDLETRVLAVLVGDVKFTVDAGVLTLEGAGGQVRAKR